MRRLWARVCWAADEAILRYWPWRPASLFAQRARGSYLRLLGLQCYNSEPAPDETPSEFRTRLRRQVEELSP
jgi:hypothetical protein